MKASKIFKQSKLSTAIIICFGLLTTVAHAQTDVKTNDSQDDLSNMTVMVYDSNNLLVRTNQLFTVSSKVNHYSTADRLSSSSALVNLLAVEFENEIEIEEWMTEPFKVNTVPAYLEPVNEEEIPLESWMTDLDCWTAN